MGQVPSPADKVTALGVKADFAYRPARKGQFVEHPLFLAAVLPRAAARQKGAVAFRILCTDKELSKGAVGNIVLQLAQDRLQVACHLQRDRSARVVF